MHGKDSLRLESNDGAWLLNSTAAYCSQWTIQFFGWNLGLGK